MKRSIMLLTALSVVLYLGAFPAFAQRGQGMGGRGSGMPNTGERGQGMSNMPSGERGQSGREMRQQGREPSKDDESKGTSSMSGKRSVDDLLTQNGRLSSKLQTLLPGTNLQEAVKGFDHLGQFVAAVHVSHNLGIPFDQLKAKMVDSSPESLGKAIHELRPKANARQEVIKANEQALEDLEKSRS